MHSREGNTLAGLLTTVTADQDETSYLPTGGALFPTVTFANASACDAYLPHPFHQAVVAKLLPMIDGGLDGVVAFDFIDAVMA
jgi:hypothetical protein